MDKAPEKLWMTAEEIGWPGSFRSFRMSDLEHPEDEYPAYVRADLYEQVKREWDGLKAENRKLRNLISATHKNPVKHENCRRHYCPICEGGLFQCADCGAVEIETEERVCTAAERLTGARVVTEAIEQAARIAESHIGEPGLSDNPAYVRYDPADLMAKKIAAAIRNHALKAAMEVGG